MIDLQKFSGLPITLTDDFHLEFGSGLTEVKPNIRKFFELVPVLMDEQAKPDPTRDEMYYMYRDVHLTQNEALLRQNHLRYDMTVLPPGMIGQEFTKTIGHYHPEIPGMLLAYPEIYEIHHGSALLFLQKMDFQIDKIVDVVAIAAQAGDKIIYPSDYGHIMVNIGTEPLVTANWEADNFDSLYQPIKQHHGMAYYVVKSARGYEFRANPSYDAPAPIRVLGLEKMKTFPIAGAEPMYSAAVSNILNLEFLTNPAKYQQELFSIIS